MQSPSITAARTSKVDAGWVAGMNSVRNPWLLGENQYKRAKNIVNRGGVIQTRPGYRMVLIAPAGNLQGSFHFRRTRRIEDDPNAIAEIDYLVVAVNGSVYAVPFPLEQPRNWDDFKLPGIQFDANVPMVHFCSGEKSLIITDSGNLSIVPTYNVLIMQDGKSPAAYWDGTESRHLDESSPALETPAGTWMVYSGGRLWVARGRLVLASDYLDPLKFTERTEGEGRGDFRLNGDITGLAPFIGDTRQEIVVVFTAERCETLQSGIKDRTQWALTPNFQSVLFPSTGCVAGRSIAFQAGLMWWYAPGGLVSSDVASTTYLTSQVNFKDAEMAFSKRLLAEDQSGICGVGFENYLLMSLPIAENLNSETFVLDYSPLSETTSDKIPAWSGVWTGIRPVQWVSANINTRRRIFAASVDYTSLPDGSHNHIWEAFMPEREDSFFTLDSDFTTVEYTQPILCEWESRLLGDGLDLKQFVYGELFFIELSGDVKINTSYRGTRGSYKEILCTKVLASTDYSASGVANLSDYQEEYGDLRKQSRHLFTSKPDANAGCPTCESKDAELRDKAFSVLVRWCGQAALESLAIWVDPLAEDSNGKCEPNETKVCIVAEDGQNHIFDREPGFIPPEDLYQSVISQSWVAERTATVELTCASGSITGPIVVTAQSTFRSRVSQSDADNNAQLAADSAAQNQADYYRTQFPCLWEGLEYAIRTCEAALNDEVTSISVQSDGKFILGGLFDHDRGTSQGKTTRRTVTGTRDLTFTRGSAANDSVRDVIVDSSNRVIVTGQFTTYDGVARSGLVRLLANGDIDTSFVVGTGISSDVAGTSLAIDSTGRILVAGLMYRYNGTLLTNGIVRLNAADGSVDGTFSPSDLGFAWIWKIAVDSSNKVLLANADGLYRLNVNGTTDGSFTSYPWGHTDDYCGIALQADGKIIFGAQGINSSKGLVRLNTGGSVDATFNVGTGLTGGSVRHVTVLVDGSVLACGSFTAYKGTTVPKIVKINSTGTIDSAFNTALGTGPNGPVNRIIKTATGYAVVGDFDEFNGEDAYYFALLNASGAYVPSFEYTTQLGVARTPLGQMTADSLAEQIAEARALAALPCT